MNASRFTTSPIMHTISGKAQPTPLCLVDLSAMSAAIGSYRCPICGSTSGMVAPDGPHDR